MLTNIENTLFILKLYWYRDRIETGEVTSIKSMVKDSASHCIRFVYALQEIIQNLVENLNIFQNYLYLLKRNILKHLFKKYIEI